MSSSNTKTAMRIGAIALILLAYWYWSTPSTPKTDKSSKKAITTTTTTTTVITTEKKNKTESSQESTEDNAATDSKQDAIETADDTNTIIPAKDSSIEKLEEIATVEVIAREIPNETVETITEKIEETVADVLVIQKDEAIVKEIVDDSTVNFTVINNAEEKREENEEPIENSIIGTIELSTSELTDTDALVTETETDLAQENDREELTEVVTDAATEVTTEVATEVTTEVATEVVAEVATETVAEVATETIAKPAIETVAEVDTVEADSVGADTIKIVVNNADEMEVLEEEEIEDPIDEFESVMVYEFISPSASFDSLKHLQSSETMEIREIGGQDDNNEAHERDIPATKPETIQTPIKGESNMVTEEPDQAGTPTTLVGEELEVTKDTLQTLQEVSRVAKHSELNARAQEFKPSWLASPQQVAPINRPEVPQVTTPAKSATKLKSRCHYWPNCTNKACKYTHPSQPCRDGDNCRFADRCIFIHPKDQTTPRAKKGPKQSATSHGRHSSSATMTSASPIEPSWGRV
ncbi:hypothetical protein BGX21_003457 [Mortierella sp. AD011]|nr:hypothetical protein BGX20_005305 [Mortierella sp. AD010]KAF9400819.1 hypothetical protein BGX21_003457 [Mortierella sp. AD011]